MGKRARVEGQPPNNFPEPIKIVIVLLLVSCVVKWGHIYTEHAWRSVIAQLSRSWDYLT